MLRPDSKDEMDRLFPERETVFKGKPTMTREGPWSWVPRSDSLDVAVHEAWDVWHNMSVMPDPDSV